MNRCCCGWPGLCAWLLVTSTTPARVGSDKSIGGGSTGFPMLNWGLLVMPEPNPDYRPSAATK